MKLDKEKLNKRQKYRLEFLKRAKGEVPSWENLKDYAEASSWLSAIEIVYDENIKDFDCAWLSYDEDDYLNNIPLMAVDKEEKTILIKIHLDRKREDIIEGVEYLLTFLKREGKLADIDFKRPKPHWDEFDKYLKVYDLRKEGKSWKKIATQVFPGDESSDSGIRKVRHYYEQALKMINGGWRLL